METFRGLPLAFEAMEKGGNMPTVYNASNEKAVGLFLQRKIKYLQITELIEASMNHCTFIVNPSLEQILDTEAKTYEYIEQLVKGW